jgi:hypothetical protein
MGTRRRVTAAALQTHHDLEGRKDNPVNADEEDANGLHEPISMAHFPKKATREGLYLRAQGFSSPDFWWHQV